MLKQANLDPKGHERNLEIFEKWRKQDEELKVTIQRVDEHDQRLDEQEKQIKDIQESQMTRCDGLKDKFRDNYDYCNAQDIQLTQKMEEARKHLSESYSVFLFGSAGEGKTTAAFRIAKSLVDDKIINLDRCAIIYEPDDLKHIKSRDVDLFLIDDIFGKHNAEASKLTLWRKWFDTFQVFVGSRKTRIIFGSRMHIYTECQRELDGYEVFSRTVELNSAELTPEEKRYILQTQLKANNKEMDDADKEECIHQKETNAGFPFCAQQFASDRSLFSKTSDYFARPLKNCLKQNLQNIDDPGFIALLYVFYKGNRLHLSETDITKMDEKSQKILQHIAKLCGIEDSIASVVKDTKQKLNNFKGSFLKCIDKTFSFLHDMMYEAVAKMHAEKYTAEVIEHCTIDYLCQCVRLEKAGDDDVLIIERDDFKSLAERCVIEVIKHDNGRRLSKHPMFENEQFVKELISKANENEETFKEFFSKGLSFTYPDGIHAFLYHIVENSKEKRIFFQEAQKHLRCSHSFESDEICWKCKVKSEALSAVCSINSNDLYDEFRADNVELNEDCLYKAVEKMDADPEFVKMIISDLKKSGKYISDNKYLQFSLGESLKQKDEQIFNILKESGIHLTTSILYFAVVHGTPELLRTFLQELVKSKRWQPDDFYTSRAIVAAHATGKTECQGILTDAGAKLTACSVSCSIIDYGFEETAHFIKTLKENACFDPDSYQIASSMAIAMTNEDKRIYQLLKEEGVMPTCHLVHAMIKIGHDTDDIVRVIEECKLAGRWDPDSSFISRAYRDSRRRADQKLTDVLVKHGAGTNPALVDAVMKTNMAELDQVLKTLKDTGRFDPSDADFAGAFVVSVEYKDKTIYNKLVSEGLYLILPCLIYAASSFSTIDTLQFVITGLKKENRWKADSDYVLHALNIAFLREDKAAYEMLLAKGLSWKTSNLYDAVRCETLHGLELIIREMKRRELFDADDDDVLLALNIAFLEEDKAAYEMLLAEGLSWKTRNLVVAVRCETLHRLKLIIREMKRRELFDADDNDVLLALNIAFLEEDKAAYEMLLAEGLSWKTRNLVVAVRCETLHRLKLIIREMKRRELFDANDNDVLLALNIAFLEEDKAAYEMLLAEGLSWKTRNLYVAVRCETLHGLKLIIREMKRRELFDADDIYVLLALNAAFLREDKAAYEMLLAEGLSWKTRNLYVAVQCETLHGLKLIIREMKRRELFDADDIYALDALNTAFLREDKAAYEMLLAEGLSWKTRNLVVAVLWEPIHRLKLIIREMKRRELFDADDNDVLLALNIAFLEEDKAAYEMLLAEGLSWNTMNLVVAVKWQPIHRLELIIREMKRRELFDADDDDVLLALNIAFLEEDKAAYEMLLAEGLSWKTGNLYVAVQCETLHGLKLIVREMKRRELFDADDIYVLDALNAAFLREDKAAHEMLLAEGLSWKTRNLLVAVKWQPIHRLKLIVREMKRRELFDADDNDVLLALNIAFLEEDKAAYEMLLAEGLSWNTRNLVVAVKWLPIHRLELIIREMKRRKLFDADDDDVLLALNIAFLREDKAAYEMLLAEGLSWKTRNLYVAVKFEPLHGLKLIIREMKRRELFDADDIYVLVVVIVISVMFILYSYFLQLGEPFY